jgi:hypothetical protein
MYTLLCIYILSIAGNLALIFIPNTIQGQQTREDLEIMKAEKEIELLDSQVNHTKSQIVNESSLQNIFLTRMLPVLGAIAIAFIPAFFAWRHERNKIPTAEQEKIINDIATKWYYHHHLYVYDRIWKKIEALRDQDQEKEIEKAWNYLCVKEFPTEKYDDKIKGFDADDIKGEIFDYLTLKLNLGKKDRLRKIRYLKGESNLRYLEEEKGLRNRINLIVNESSVSYYDRIQQVLPGVAQKAVLATLGEKDYANKNYEDVFDNSLKKLMRMMVFYRIREDKEITKTILRSAVYTVMKDSSNVLDDRLVMSVLRDDSKNSWSKRSRKGSCNYGYNFD